MSYSGTVSCRHCGGVGHNRRTCPDYKALLDRQAGDGNKWAQATLNRRNRKSVRKCGWCDETGHNKRTCPIKVEAENLIPKVESKLVELSLKVTSGVGRGTILDRGGETAVVLKCHKNITFGAGRISKETVEENKDNADWVRRVFHSLADNITFECVQPDGRKIYHHAPLKEVLIRDVPQRVGWKGTKLVVASDAPIECEVKINLNAGMTASQLEGWIATIDMLLEEITEQ